MGCNKVHLPKTAGSPRSVQHAFQAHGNALREEEVYDWSRKVDLPTSATGVKVGLILRQLAFGRRHDVMCTVLAGHDVHVKLSKDDAVLPRRVVAKWAEMVPYVTSAVTFHDGLMKDMDAVVATGGANASRYFEAYFGHCHTFFEVRAHLSRSGRRGVRGGTRRVGRRHLRSFGLGCRSVTKVWLPEGLI